MSEWATKEELAKELNIKDIDKEITKLIDNKFIEQKGDKFKINNQDGKANERINDFLDDLNNKYSEDKYYPNIRHGYLHLKHKLEQKHKFPKDVVELSL